jgi:hypothetical protein
MRVPVSRQSSTNAFLISFGTVAPEGFDNAEQRTKSFGLNRRNKVWVNSKSRNTRVGAECHGSGDCPVRYYVLVTESILPTRKVYPGSTRSRHSSSDGDCAVRTLRVSCFARAFSPIALNT